MEADNKKGKKQLNKFKSLVYPDSFACTSAKKFKKWHSTFWENLATSIKLHNISNLIVINHNDCGAAKIVNGNNKFSTSIENKIHNQSFKIIKRKLKKKHPSIKVSFKIMKI